MSIVRIQQDVTKVLYYILFIIQCLYGHFISTCPSVVNPYTTIKNKIIKPLIFLTSLIFTVMVVMNHTIK